MTPFLGSGMRLLAGLSNLLLLASFAAPAVSGATFNIANGDVAGLIAAINAANAAPDPDTINLAANGIYELTAVHNTSYWTGPTGLPQILNPLAINGNGATIRRSSALGTPDFRILYVGGPGGNLTLDRATITGGRSAIGAPGYIGGGGGIRVDGGVLLVSNSTIHGNSGVTTGSNDGGGILNYQGTVTLINCTITGNTSWGGYGGGGILNLFGSSAATLTIIHSTIVGNIADAPPGFQGRGAAIAGVATVRASILGSPSGIGDDCYGTVTSQGYNLAGDASCSLTGPSDLKSTDALASALANNGGPTSTMELQTGSPAINRVPTAFCKDALGAALTQDQRGSIRPQGSACDTGAFERVAGIPTWTLTNSMTQSRYAPALATLPSGKILVAGGTSTISGALSQAEIYDPATALWNNTQPLPQPRGLNAIRLNDGDILAFGENSTIPATAYRYRESTGLWTAAGDLSIGRFQPASALLPNGKVLVTGGYNNQCCAGPTGTYATAELFDPSTNTWSPLTSMSETKAIHTATLLPNGKVLVAGGAQRDPVAHRDSVQIFDPATNTWSPAANMNNARSGHTATLLGSGKVLVTGGFTGSGFTPQNTAEIYDPGTNTWTPAAPMSAARSRHNGVLLPTGELLVTGGLGPLSSTEVYNPATDTWTTVNPMNHPRYLGAATGLPGGRVLALGGLINGSTDTPTAEIWGISGVDTTVPVITSPLGTVLAAAGSGTGANVSYAASATDNSGVVSSFGCTPPSGSLFPIGDTVVTCTATDPSGNTASQSFTIHVAGATEISTALKNLLGTIGTKSGTAAARVWPVSLRNLSTLPLPNVTAKLVLTQSAGPSGCTPVIAAPNPATYGNLAQGVTITKNFTINFSSCTSLPGSSTIRFNAKLELTSGIGTANLLLGPLVSF